MNSSIFTYLYQYLELSFYSIVILFTKILIVYIQYVYMAHEKKYTYVPFFSFINLNYSFLSLQYFNHNIFFFF